MEGGSSILSSSSSSSSTNWIVSSGSLNNSITFETPLTDDVLEQDESKHPLVVLNSPSDSTFCEIKVSFAQSHEMRQVYVRSSARVYEIYYATKLDQKDNEYLCTVRCSLAQKEDQSNNSTNEDGWVEILDTQSCSISKKNDERSIQDFYEATAEITDSSPCVSITIRLLSLHTKECVHLEDIYIFGEPVEIVDLDDKVDPMKRSAEISMMAMLPTLMQLSRTGMPNRMPDKQVSDIRPHLKGQDDESLDPYVGRTLHSEALSSQLNQKVTKDVSQSTHVESDELVPGAVQEHGSVDKLNDSSSGRIERVLDQLVCRVGRIEAFCSRFEDNMLKPISNIETRLERLEKQLEVLTVSSQSTDLNPCRRIRAPDFSCIESETNSLQNDEEENSNCGVLQFASKDATSTRQSECLSDGSESNDNAFISTVISQLVPSIPCIQSETKSFQNDEGENSNCGVLSESLSKDATFTTQLKCLSDGSESNDNASDSVDAPQSIPGLIVTAPEFSNEDFGEDDNVDNGHCGELGSGDDKNCSDDFASAKIGSPVGKRSLSVDDALAVYLCGFMSSASAQPSKVNQPSSTVATASPNEDHGGNGSSTFPARISCQRDAYPSGWFAGSNGIENLMNFNSTSSDTPQDNEEHATRLPTDGSTLGITIACVLPEEGRNGSCDGSLDDALSMAHDGCMSSALAMAPIMEVNQPSRMVATAPDEDQVGNDSFTFPARTSFKSEVDSSRWFNGPKGIENLKNLDPTSSDTPQDNEEQVAILPKDDPTGVIRESVLPGLLDGSSDGSPDDVLAVAHGGLMSSASAQATTINQSLSTVATASSNENHGGNDSVTYPARTSCQRDADSSRWFAGPNGNLDPTSSDSPRDTEEEATRFPTDDSTVGVVPGPVHPVEGSDRDLQDWLTSVTGPVLPVEGSDRDLQDWLTSVVDPELYYSSW